MVTRLYSLSMGLLRAETVFDKYYEEATILFASGKTDDQLVEEIPDAITNLKKNALVRSGSLLSVYLGLLYAVVEAWRDGKFVDDAVEKLLKNQFVKDLKSHRNAIFHVSEATDPRIMQWGLDPNRVVWAKELASALRSGLLSYHADLETKAVIHITKPT